MEIVVVVQWYTIQLTSSLCFVDRDQPQRSISQPNEETAKPNLFKRAWMRVSQRKTRKKRARSQSEPGPRPNSERSNHPIATTSRQLPKEPENDQEAVQFSGKSGTSSIRRMTTPEGYEMMDENNADVSITSFNKTRTSRTSYTSVDEPINNLCPEKTAIEEETDDPDGYVLVDGLPDVETILKEAEKQFEEEAKKQDYGESEEIGNPENTGYEIVETKLEMSEKDEKNKNDVIKQKGSEDEPKRGSVGYDNVDLSSVIALTNGNETSDISSKCPPKTPTRPKSLDSNQVNSVNTQKSRRGMRKPPPDIVLSDDACSPENPYVNSPPLKSVDYVNIPGSNRGNNTGFRSRSKTTKQSNVKSRKLNPYEKYDGNDDSIYHSVESLLPGNPTYQNIRAESNRSHSYTNLPSHTMNGQTYQNVGPPGQQAYVNVTPRKKKFQKNQNTHHLNYIQVEGTDGVPVFSGQSSFSPPVEQANSGVKSSSSEYTWIDESKTRLLKETARMHSDLRKENLPKVSKKY